MNIIIPHDYGHSSDNLAQYSADEIDRQEVTHEFMLDVKGGHGLFDCCYFWRGDDDAEMGLDPWRIVDDIEMYLQPDTRIFVERKHLADALLEIRNATDRVIVKCEADGNDVYDNAEYFAAQTSFWKLTVLRDEQLRCIALNESGHIAGLHPTVAKALRDSDVSWEKATRSFRARMNGNHE